MMWLVIILSSIHLKHERSVGSLNASEALLSESEMSRLNTVQGEGTQRDRLEFETQLFRTRIVPMIYLQGLAHLDLIKTYST